MAKLRAFISTLYGLDRAFTRRGKRQFEFEIVDLNRNSPATIAMRARVDVAGYDAAASIEWAFEQLQHLRNGQAVDNSVSQGLMDNVVELAHAKGGRLPELGVIKASYRGNTVLIDTTLENRALAARALKAIDMRSPWRAGVSYGSAFGELRGVMDFDGERQFFIVPPTGPAKIQCNFEETLRGQMIENLFKTVRVSGYLHYDGRSPFPTRIEADKMVGMSEPTGHFSDLRGIFRGLEMSDGAMIGDLA